MSIRSHKCGTLYSKKIPPGTLDSIEKFCTLLTSNKVKDSKASFLKLPYIVQCMFLHYGWEIMSHKNNHSNESYMYAFLLFKLFRGKDMKNKPIYKRYLKLKSLDTQYSKALAFKKKNTNLIKKSSSSGIRKPRKSYNKEGQRYDSPTSELDPLYLYYTSLYTQKPESRLAVTWLTEHGVYDGSDRSELVSKYKILAANKQLVR